MPRLPRLQFEDAVYHVTGRCVHETSLFRDDDDRHRYLELLEQVGERAGIRTLAYALMTTHMHLVIQTPRANVSVAMQWLHGRYAARFNGRPDRRGHLFGGRFYSTIVDTDSYLLEVTRYVHLNPVRAGLVSYPEDYPWSSYRKYLGHDVETPVDPAVVLDIIAPAGSDRFQEYRRFVEEPLVARLRRLPPGSPEWDDAAFGAVADALGVARAEILGRRSLRVRTAAISLLADELGLSPARIAATMRIRADSAARALRRATIYLTHPGFYGTLYP